VNETSVLCASGSLGLTPMHHDSYWAAVDDGPDAIVADAGSGDIGANYLGSGAEYNPREWEKHDLRLMLTAARRLGIPMIVGSAGGAGTNASTDRYVELVKEIAQEESLSGFSMARIYAEVEPEELARRAEQGEVPPLGPGEPLSPDDARRCARVVAMMGVEPILNALEQGADVIIAGRSCDDAIFGAVPILHGHDRALSLHMGKTIECGPLVATPIVMREAIVGTVRDDDFLVIPYHPDQRCTPMSVAGHTLYERLNPYRLPVPGGAVELHDAVFEAHTERVCRVAGAKWSASDTYAVKLEGSAFVGHRGIFLFGLRDPISIANIDKMCDGIAAEVARQYGPSGNGRYHLDFHVYGRDAILGAREPQPEIASNEICVVIDVVAPDREDAKNVAKMAKYCSLRVHYPGKLGTAGGCAMLSDEVLMSSIPGHEWVLDHVLPLEDPLELFPMELERV
jgi:acyclic terpene utilization AtuA family protein